MVTRVWLGLDRPKGGERGWEEQRSFVFFLPLPPLQKKKIWLLYCLMAGTKEFALATKLLELLWVTAVGRNPLPALDFSRRHLHFGDIIRIWGVETGIFLHSPPPHLLLAKPRRESGKSSLQVDLSDWFVHYFEIC